MKANELKRGMGAVLLSLFFVSCAAPGKVSVSYAGDETTVIKTVKEEINELFAPRLTKGACGFTLVRDASLTDGDFAYVVEASGKNKYEIILSGSGDIEIAHAFYTLLENAGYQFNIGGAVIPDVLDMEKVASERPSEKVRPAVRWRGIRQHVNFPMDISSYPIGEAKEYLKNMLRMRFNKLAVHSYSSQWYNVEVNGKQQYAGHFFYGNRHPIPDDTVVRNHIRFNEEYFVIPEIEPVYLDEPRCSEAAVEWMDKLTSYARELGMEVSMSADPNKEKDLDDVMNIVRFIAEHYPAVTQLELISEEMGGWGEGATAEQLHKTIVSEFGPEALEIPLVKEAVANSNSDLERLFYQTGRNIRAIRLIESDPSLKDRFSSLMVGSYCTNPLFTRMIYQLTRKELPGHDVTVLPAHGSRRVNDHFRQAVTDPEDMARAVLYSWIEFDGLMFLQQNCVRGIHDVAAYMQQTMGGRQVNALLFNHWRTEENRTAARYAALATIYGAIPEDEFYARMADELGIAGTEDYRRAMKMLDDADWDATNNLPNIGFCWVGAWNGGGSFTWMPREAIRRIRDMYQQTGEILSGVLKKTSSPAGRSYLDFLCNRTACTVVYLNAFEAGCAIQDIKPAADGSYSESQKQQYVQACNEALVIFDQYMYLHTRLMPDRGTEGTLINTWQAPVRGLKILRNKVGGIAEDDPMSSTSATAPPLPIFYQE